MNSSVGRQTRNYDKAKIFLVISILSLSICLSLSLSLYLSISLFLSLSVYLSLSLSICLSLSLSVYLSLYLSICIFISLYLSICLSLFLSICLSISHTHSFSVFFLCLKNNLYKTLHGLELRINKLMESILQNKIVTFFFINLLLSFHLSILPDV